MLVSSIIMHNVAKTQYLGTKMYFLFMLMLLVVSETKATSEVSRSPKIVDQAERLNHPEGTNATFMCSIGSGELEGLSYEWLKDEKRILPSSKMRISVAAENFNSILRVIDLKPEDSGVYSCVARNSFGQDKISIRLMVKVQLKWVIQPTDVETSVGKSFRIPCAANGLPAPRIEWRKLSDNSTSESEQLGPELSFESVSQEEGGNYECRAKNGVEKDLVARVRVNVLGFHPLDQSAIGTK